MLVLLTILALGGLASVAARPRSGRAAAVAAICAGLAVATGAAPAGLLETAARSVGPLALFLMAAVWLSAFAERSGLALRLAGWLERGARGSRAALFGLVCALCAALTATVSLDGAVVMMVPVLIALSRRSADLMRPMLLATIGVANAFSLALPQGNPTNLVVMERLGLSPAEFVGRLLVPAVLATAACVTAIAVTQRRSLRGHFTAEFSRPGRWTAAERLAAGGLAMAGLLGAAAPWVGLPSWWPICAVAGAVAAFSAAARVPRPPAPTPVRVCVQVAALVILVGALLAAVPPPAPVAGSLLAVVALALVAGAVACTVNNLPASVVLACVLGSHPLAAGAVLAGLSVGAMGTPHGSVATLLALDRAETSATGVGSGGDLGMWIPTAGAATALAAVVLWLLR